MIPHILAIASIAAAITNTVTNTSNEHLTSGADWASTWTAIGTVALALVAVAVAICESRRDRFSRSVDLILKLDERFNSEEWLKKRHLAAKCLKEKTYVDPNDKRAKDSEDVLDYFETIGYLMKRKALDEKMVWHIFYHWIMGYYEAGKDYMKKRTANEETVWEDFGKLYRTMDKMEKYQIPIDEFLSEEIDEERYKS